MLIGVLLNTMLYGVRALSGLVAVLNDEFPYRRL
jgi:hypothetical protein